MTRTVAAAELTVMPRSPVIELVTVSVAVRVRAPTWSRATPLKVKTPPSPRTKVWSAGRVELPASMVRWTVPV